MSNKNLTQYYAAVSVTSYYSANLPHNALCTSPRYTHCSGTLHISGKNSHNIPHPRYTSSQSSATSHIFDGNNHNIPHPGYTSSRRSTTLHITNGNRHNIPRPRTVTSHITDGNSYNILALSQFIYLQWQHSLMIKLTFGSRGGRKLTKFLMLRQHALLPRIRHKFPPAQCSCMLQSCRLISQRCVKCF